MAVGDVGVAVTELATTDAGARGGATGAAVTHVLAAPTPAALRAPTRNTYANPFDNPETIVVVVGALTTPTLLQVTPPLADASTT